ncbi:MAG: ATPase [Lachnospiraceae bacterium]|nr:ATPase [Lachnospiraceae bacterium]
MSSKIEQVIDEIEDFVEHCRYQPLSNTKIVVNKDELDDLLADLRRKVPDEIKNYQRMLSNKENIIADARAKADSIIADAQVQTTELISDHEIMQQVYERADEVVAAATNEAQEILDRAAMDADAIRMGAIEYTDSILKEIEEILASAMETTQARSENLLHSLQGCYDEIRSNRGELGYDGMQTASLQDAEATQNT